MTFHCLESPHTKGAGSFLHCSWGGQVAEASIDPGRETPPQLWLRLGWEAGEKPCSRVEQGHLVFEGLPPQVTSFGL